MQSSEIKVSPKDTRLLPMFLRRSRGRSRLAQHLRRRFIFDEISKYSQYGYGNWTFGAGLSIRTSGSISCRLLIAVQSVTKKAKLLNFFTISDIHITDKESPNQLIYLQRLHPNIAGWCFAIFRDYAVYNSCSRRSRPDGKRPSQKKIRLISVSLWAIPATALSTTN